MKKNIIFLSLFFITLIACKEKSADPQEDVEPSVVQAPVTVTHIDSTTLYDVVELNATSTFLHSNLVKASANGYLRQVNLEAGQRVESGRVIFVIKTKEAEALGNSINALDSSFRFTGLITIKAPLSGYVQQLNHQLGDYVQEGEQLAIISDDNSFGFTLNIPFEYLRFVRASSSMTITLPDSSKLTGMVSRILPNMDSISQTQQVFLRVSDHGYVPQNLIGKVRIVKQQKQNAQSLPRPSILSNEAQSEFWVMKLIDDTTAVRVTIQKGMESGGKVEIVSPRFMREDRIILTGNYGLSDTAAVKIQKEN
jgi:multidrug efflux pump subunit AcrA (membrane-fusion protein)